jgi:predicted dehydrogenase
MSEMPKALGVGLVGAGAFGEFCLQAFAQLNEIKIAAVCDVDADRALRLAATYGASAYTSLDQLLEDGAVEVVAINTPPHLHAAYGLAALQAGRHLFSEKPIAMTLSDANALVQAAMMNDRRLTIDYVMRRNPLWRGAVALRESGVLGRLLHMDLINHAAGLNLSASHWFWDKAQSGGIWIEHGVHFFDAFAWVAGQPGRVTTASAWSNASGQEDRVEALATFGEVAAHFYHGFTHSSANEQTTVRLTFEYGHVSLLEWVPTVLQIDGLTGERAEQVAPLLPIRVGIRHHDRDRAVIQAVLSQGKTRVYAECIQGGIRELAQAVRNPDRPLAVTGAHGVDSLRMALEAERLGQVSRQ